MMRLHVGSTPRPPNYLIKIYITIVGNIRKTDQDGLKDIYSQLQQAVPGNLKVHYNLSSDQLVLIAKGKNALEAKHNESKLVEHIRSASSILKIRL